MKILKEDYDRYSRVIRTGLTHKLDKDESKSIKEESSWREKQTIVKNLNLESQVKDLIDDIDLNGRIPKIMRRHYKTNFVRYDIGIGTVGNKEADKYREEVALPAYELIKSKAEAKGWKVTFAPNVGMRGNLSWTDFYVQLRIPYNESKSIKEDSTRNTNTKILDLLSSTSLQRFINHYNEFEITSSGQTLLNVGVPDSFDNFEYNSIRKELKQIAGISGIYWNQDENLLIIDVTKLAENTSESESINEDIDKSTLSTAGPIAYAVKLLYQMDRFVMDVYDNEGWLMYGVPDGEFEETTAEEAMKNYTEHDWLITDMESGKLSAEDFSEFIDTFKSVTHNKNYDQEERARIIAEAEDLLKEYSAKIDECDKLEENAHEDHAYSKEEVIAQLKQELPNLGNNGKIKYGFKSEAEAAEEFLSNHYAHVELDKAGSWFQIDYAELLKD